MLGAQTPFSVEGLADAAIQLKQTGTSMSEMNEILRMIGDTAGGSTDKFNRLVANYAQIQSVGKTTAMDLKQFAMMGLPIYDVLKDMGIQGAATGEQITEAFKRMTAEGSAFYNGMAKGAETLSGRTSTLKDTWKEWQATFAESSGLGAAWKKVLETLTDVISASTNAMTEANKIKELQEQEKAGTIDAVGYYDLLNYKLMTMKDTYAQYVELGYDKEESMQDAIIDMTAEIALMESQISLAKTRAEEAKKQKEQEEAYLALIEETNNKYSDGINKINASYADTTQGQKQAIQDEIKSWEELLTIKQMVAYTTPYGVKGYNEVGIDEETKDKVYAIIDGLKEKLEGLDKKTKDSIKTWREWWEEITGVGVDLTESGVIAAQKYIDGAAEELGRNKTLSQLLGNEFDIGTILESQLADIEKNIGEALSIAKDKIANGDVFTFEDDSIKGLIAYYKELKKELDTVIEAEKERKRIEESAESVTALRKQVEYLSVIGDERQRIQAIQNGIVDADLEQYLLLQDQIEALNVQRDLYGQIALAKKRAIESGDMAGYAGASVAETGMNALQGSEAGDFIQGTIETGDPMGGLIKMLAGDFAFLLGEVNGMSYALSPFRGLILGLTPVVKELFTPLLKFSYFLTLVGEKLAKWLGKEYEMGEEWDKIVEAMGETKDKQEELGDETAEQLRQLKELNKQYKNLTTAMKEQEDYYLEQKRDLMSSTLSDLISAQKVNDLVITRDGKTFVTDSADSIIATKNPESLGSGSMVNIHINNTAGEVVAKVTREENNNGIKDVFIEISRKIASDFAMGENGWDNAVSVRNYRKGGRSIST